MKLSEFTYDLPEDLIAQYPLKRRDQARLMIVERSTGQITHDIFANVSKYLSQKSSLVINNSKVIPARLLTRRQTGGEVEIFLLKRLSLCEFHVLVKPLRKVQLGEVLTIKESSVQLTLINKEVPTVRFLKPLSDTILAKLGHIPLPPYIKRPDEESDKKDYQNVYAAVQGSVASPTAGLHFTKSLLGKLAKSGHRISCVTLHVNYATFKPVETENIEDHPIHSEDYSVETEVWRNLQNDKKEGRAIVAVGTTSCRVLETISLNKKINGQSQLFIYPGFKFKMVDMLITNFHQPYTTLLMLVAGFAGKDLMFKAYQEAVEKRYRFFSYGDAMLIR